MWTSHHSSPSPQRGEGRPWFPHPPRVDVHHRGTAAELPRHLRDQLRRAHRRRVNTDLLGARLDEPRGVLQRANAAAHGERHENLFGHPPHHVEQDGTPFVTGADVEEHQLVGPVLLVAAGDLDGVAGVAEVEEVGALDHAAAVHVQTGDDAFGQHDGYQLLAGVRTSRFGSDYPSSLVTARPPVKRRGADSGPGEPGASATGGARNRR